MVFGWVLAGLGLLSLVFPRPLVVAARGWRLGMPSVEQPGARRVARVGALFALVAGVVIVIA